MKKIANILVKYRLIFFVVSVAVAVGCAFLIPQVTINSDQTKYLAEDSAMHKGLEIMEKEFSSITLPASFQIMFEGLTPSERAKIYEELQDFDHVTSVTYEEGSQEHNTKTYTMYIVQTESGKADSVITAMKEAYRDTYPVETYNAGAYLDVLDRLIPMAVSIGVIVLLLLCKSYFEPVLLLASIGVAILINMGSNVIFESVSDMTFAIAAVFQLVLSVDYSIMLMHRYEQEYDLLGRTNKKKAMRNAIINAFGSIASSSLTTIVGLLVLLFMSFTIGADIGLVISKGVFFSLVCVFTVMPSLILWFDEWVFKLNKDYLKQRRLQKKGGDENV